MIKASLKELFTDGRLGPIRLGTPRSVIADLLGEPDDYSVNSRSRQRKRMSPAVWKYGDIELHFEDRSDRLCLIFLEGFSIPSGGTKLHLDPWIVQKTLTIEALEHALAAEHILYRRHHEVYDDPDTQRVRVGVDVDCLFTTDGSGSSFAIISYSNHRNAL